MLDAVVDFLPSPLDVPDMKGVAVDSDQEMTRKSSDDEPFSGLAFKIMTDPFVGSITFVRVYSGILNSATTVLNTVKEEKERVGRMLLMHANSREDIKEARAGDIVALCGLKNTTTGDTLCDPAHPIVLERMEFPEPVIEVAVEPKSKADQEKMGVALNRLAQEDPCFRVNSDPESGQTIIKGMGELHLEILVDRMKREFKVEANVGAPQVAYRESITKKVEHDYTHKKQTGGSGQFARVKIRFEPLEAGAGFVFENSVVGGSVPREYVPGVEKGLKLAKETGVIAGFPLIDFKATLIDGAYHDVDSNVLTFEIAARACFREAHSEGRPALARADDEGRSRDARRLHGRRHRRSELASWPGPGHGQPRQRARHHRDGAAREHVRLRQHPALDEPGPRPVHDAFRPLRAGSTGGRGRSPRQDGLIGTTSN